MQEKFPKASLLCQYGDDQTGSLPVFSTDAKILNKTDKKQLKSKNQIKNNNKKQKQKHKKERKRKKQKQKKQIYIYIYIYIY